MREYFPKLIGNDALRKRLGAQIDAPTPKLSHAYIIEGAGGSGRSTLAINIAAALACERADDQGYPLPCGECDACRKVLDGHSPDVTVIARESGKASLGVEAVRLLKSDIHIIPNELRYKVYIIDEADKMTVQAQNALLLSLEEPPPYVLFLLLCESSGELLETVRSRASVLRLRPLDRDTLSDAVIRLSPAAASLYESDRAAFGGMLMASGGSIGRAISLMGGKDGAAVSERAAACAEFCRICAKRPSTSTLIPLIMRPPFGSPKRETVADTLGALLSAIRDLILLGYDEDAPLGFFYDRDEAIFLADSLSGARLMALYDAAELAYGAVNTNANIRLTLLRLCQSAAEICQ